MIHPGSNATNSTDKTLLLIGIETGKGEIIIKIKILVFQLHDNNY